MTANADSGLPGEPPSGTAAAVEPFAAALESHGLSLLRRETRALQINTGLLCNLRCRHCHLEAGPERREVMSRETMSAVIALAERFPFQVIDITGGAPEMVPDIPFLIEGLARLAPRRILRSNLVALSAPEREGLLALCAARRVVLTVSFPSTSPSQADAQRGAGFADAGVGILKRLNGMGYGVEGLMCRTQLSVSWDGHLYDCDFNLAMDRHLEGRKVHVSEVRKLPPPGTPIAVGEHCFACTVGCGFT